MQLLLFETSCQKQGSRPLMRGKTEKHTFSGRVCQPKRTGQEKIIDLRFLVKMPRRHLLGIGNLHLRPA
jgi:hypothetical protein